MKGRVAVADVTMVDGRLTLIISAEAAGVVASLLEQALAAHYRLGRRPIPLAHDVLASARAAHALAALTVPPSEPLLAPKITSSGVWITTKQAAELLHIGERAVIKRIAAGALGARKESGRWRVRLDARAA